MKDAFISAVRAAGIVGQGGAGFPAHVKYAAKADTVIANGCECEPLLRTDQHLMTHHAHEVAAALARLGNASGAGRGIFALKKKHKSLIPIVDEACKAHGLEMALLDDFYPAGDEQILVRECTGRSTPPLGLPLHAGCIVANVGTLAAVEAAVTRNEPVTRKTLTVTGAVARPGVVTAPLGTCLCECLAAAGGATTSDPVFVLGGPMMGGVIEGMDALRAQTVTKTTGGIIALPRGHTLHRNATQPLAAMRARAASACIQCRACSDLCPRRLIGQPFETHRVMRAFATGTEVENGTMAQLCCECGLCEHYACPMQLSPRRVNQAVKAAMREAGVSYEGPRDLREEQTMWREWRRVPVTRLAARLGLGPWLHREVEDLGAVRPTRVRIALRQHIGAPSVPLVRVGDVVTAGQCVGDIPDQALGARIHTGTAGRVAAVDSHVTIEAQ